MSFFESKFRFAASLMAYAVILAVALLYFRFPTEQLKLYCETELEQLVKGTDCTISGIRYSFPFAIGAKSIRFTDAKQKDRELFVLSNVRISPNPAAIRSRFGLQLDAFGGEHSCDLFLNSADKEFTLEDIRVNGLDPGKTPFLQQASKREISGIVDGTGTFHGVWRNGKYVTDGKGKLDLRDGNFGLLLPILSLDSIDLKTFETELSFEKSILHCEKGKFHGNEFDGEFSGTISLLSGLKRAALSFKGELEPLPAFLQKSKHARKMMVQLKKQRKRGTVPFILQGTVQKPSFKFES